MRLSVFILGVFFLTTYASEPIVVPITANPPVIDGIVSPGEWAKCTGFAGLVDLNSINLERRRAEVLITADKDNIYIACKTQLPDKGQLQKAATNNSTRVVYDDALEIFIDPTPLEVNHVDYQFLANPAGKYGYSIHKTGSPDEFESWSGDYQQVHSEKDGWWTAEVRIPIKSMRMVKQGRTTLDGIWNINVCRDWRPDWSWSTLAGGKSYPNAGMPVRFVDGSAPTVICSWSGDPTNPKPASTHHLIITNPGSTPLKLAAHWSLDRNIMPSLSDEAVVTLAPGESKELKTTIESSDPTTRYTLNLSVKQADGDVMYFQRSTSFVRAKGPLSWVAGELQQRNPIEIDFAYYPTTNFLRVQPDIGGMPKSAVVDSVLIEVSKTKDKTIFRQAILAKDFKNGKAAISATLPELDGEYQLTVTAKGTKVPNKPAIKTFERKHFPWENTTLGTSTTVYAPFTPITLSANKLGTVLRTHTLNNFGLIDQIDAEAQNTGIVKPVLVAPMKYRAVVDKKVVTLFATEPKVVEQVDNHAVIKGSFYGGALKAQWTQTWDVDGCVRVDLELLPTGGAQLDSLDLEIPFSSDGLMIHANSDRIRCPVAQKVPSGSGIVWDASRVACDDYIKNFCPYVFVGTANRGLCWFAENDRGWSWDTKTPNLDLLRRGDQIVLRVHLVNKPAIISETRTISFGMLAAPVKPRLVKSGENPNWWRYRYALDKYQLLGTDINWGAIGSCGSVYPADLDYWKWMKEGNKRPLTDAEVAAAVKHTEPFVAEWTKGSNPLGGTGNLLDDAWRPTLSANLRNHVNSTMVFYYNRSTNEIHPEYQTFMDEWNKTDWRSGGKGRSLNEIAIVPSKSFIDYNLYWYVKSFEIANNQGVYWDNYFFNPTTNTVMTGAYTRDDGTVVPSTGVWGMRELVRRTFQMMNERGMLPITFPHMTSFSALPMLAFATMQYDLEWKYYEGDAQDRFTPEYHKLICNGELAGTWPVLLGNGGWNQELWQERTYVAMALTYEEVVRSMGDWAESSPMIDTISAFLKRPGVVAYRYWDERPQPVSANMSDVLTTLYLEPGKEAIAVVVGWGQNGQMVGLNIDKKALGMGDQLRVVNIETGADLIRSNANQKPSFSLPRHEVRFIRITKK